MPGVPSGRGCDACRKQKKKCDVAGGTCSRCKRLQIHCVGSGKQRYKFIHTKEYSLDCARQAPAADAITLPLRDNSLSTTIINPIPTNRHTQRIAAFIDKLNPLRGVKYNLAWSYGDYLLDVPARLGSNEALDAAADALITASDRLSAGYAGQSYQFLAKYTEAVRVLRLCLNDQWTARTSETLCAVMLLTICQMFVPGRKDRLASHSEGAAQIYRYRGRQKGCDDFERKLICTLRGPVLFEALFNENINLTAEEWDELIGAKPDGASLEGQLMNFLGRAPLLMRRGGFVLGRESRMQEPSPSIEHDAHILHQDFLPVLAGFRERFHAIETPKVSGNADAKLMIELRNCHYLRTYGLGLFVGIVLNYIISMSGGGSSRTSEVSQCYGDEIIVLARAASRYRPLGAGALSVCLAAVSSTSNSAETKAAAEELLFEYDRDFRDVCTYS